MMVADRKALLEEFNTVVAPQKAALSTRLPQLFQQYYAPPRDLHPTAAAAANGSAVPSQAAKRGPPTDQAHPDSKRLKQQNSVLGDADKRLEGLFRDVNNLINKKLLQKKESTAFKEPVDPVKLKIPDYFTFVKQPMDLGTVRSKLQRKEYKTVTDVCEDVRLVFRNCATYNQAGTPVRKAGDMLADVWEKAWQESRIEERWAEIMYQKDPTGGVVPFKVAQLTSQLKSAISIIPAGGVQLSDTLSDLEKRKLSIQLADLQGEQLAGLLALIQDDLPAAGSDDEVELDLDALPGATLVKMQAFVNRVVAGRPSALPTVKQTSMQDDRSMGHAETAHAQGGDNEDMAVAGSSGQTSPAVSADSQEVKGSTMDDANGKAPFVVSSKAGVDESATAPNVSSSILRDRTAARKPDVHVNAANWDVAALQPAIAEQEEEQGDADDEMWQNFRSKEEKAKQQAEEQRKLKEQQEEELRKVKEAEAEEARRAASEAEEKERALQAEEARLQEEQQRARMEQCNKEVDEIKARQGTANLVQRDDMHGLAQATPNEGDLAAVGLTYRNDDEDVNFDDE